MTSISLSWLFSINSGLHPELCKSLTRAAGVLSKEALFTSGIVADINPDTCCGCLGCVAVCPYGAINFIENRGICQVNKVLCKGCGGCAATCPSGSARLDGFSNQQIYAQIEQAMAV